MNASPSLSRSISRCINVQHSLLQSRFLQLVLFAATLFFGTSIVHAQETFKPTLKPIAWGQIHYLDDAGLTSSETFRLRRMRAGVQGNVSPRVGFHFQVEAMGAGNNLDATLIQGWVDYRLHDALNIRVGQFKYPFGLEVSTTGPPVWKFVHPSYASGGIAQTLGQEGASYRDLGLQLGGEVDLGTPFVLGYQLMGMNGNGINTVDTDGMKDIVGRTYIQLPSGIRAGVSYYAGHTGEETSRWNEQALGFHAHVRHQVWGRALEIQGEYMQGRYRLTEGQVKSQGYYLYAAYALSQAIETGLRYDTFSPDAEIQHHRVTAMLGYYLTAKQRINVNYEIRHDDGASNIGNLVVVQFQFGL